MRAKIKTIQTEDKKFLFRLVAKTNFRDYKRGDQIIDLDEINNILNCHEKSMVIKVLNRGVI